MRETTVGIVIDFISRSPSFVEPHPEPQTPPFARSRLEHAGQEMERVCFCAGKQRIMSSEYVVSATRGLSMIHTHQRFRVWSRKQPQPIAETWLQCNASGQLRASKSSKSARIVPQLDGKDPTGRQDFTAAMMTVGILSVML